MQQYQTFRLNILPHLIVKGLRQKYLIQNNKGSFLVNLLFLDLQLTLSLIQIKTEQKAELQSEQDKITKLQALDSNYFNVKSHFKDKGRQNY